MNLRKKLIATAVASVIASPVALAEITSYQMRVPTKVVNGDWLGLPATYSEWVDVGNHYDCNAWRPAPSEVDFGQSYLQSRMCFQDQERVVTVEQQHTATGEIEEIRTFKEFQTINEEESQVATGERRDWRSYESTFTEWVDVSGAFDHTAWGPTAAAQVNDYTQGRNYLVTQERYEQKRERDAVTGDIRDTGEPIRHEQNDTRTETRSVDVTVTAWANTAPKVCGAWSPEPLSVDFGRSFTQTRTCDQDQQRVWSHKADGSEIHTRTESRVNTFDETQQAVGERRDWQSFDSTFTEWTNIGSRKNFTVWTPEITTQESDFGQTRDYDQDQQRFEQKREKDAVTGDIRDVGTPITHNQTISGTESRVINVTIGSWIDDGAHYQCGEWSPSLDTVNYGESFTQTRDCSQDQTRSRIYKDGSTTVDNQTDARTITETESQQATGSYRNWEPTTSTFTAWTNDGARYGHSAWSPVPNAQTAGFTQTRTYSQDQDRYEQKRERDSVTGDIRDVGEPILREQTISGSESRSVTVSWSSWVNNGADQNCGTWGPDPSTVNYGETFTQSRQCDEPQKRTRTYTANGSTIHTAQETRLNEVTRTQQATGTKRDWQPIASTFTAWTNNGSRYGHTAWSPAANAQTAGFTQTRSYSQDQDRYEQKREQDAVTGDIRAVGEPILREQTITGSESRSVAVSWSSWTNNGADQNCGTWSPAPSTVNYGETFTQSRTCDEPEKRDRIYKVGTSTINTAQETRLNEVTRTQTATGTKRVWEPTTSTFTAWTDTGSAYGHTAWSPAPTTQTTGFTQTRSYSHDQNRYEQKREKDAVTGDIRDVGSPILRTQTVTRSESRNVTVSWSSWINNGADQNCGTWSPSTSTVNYGQSFTQSRICDEPQKRNRIYKVGTSTIDTAQETRLNEVTRTQQATGTKRDWQPTSSTYTSWTDTGSAYGYGTWSPAPSTQTAAFTQSRSYSHDQNRYEQKRERDSITGDIRNVGDPILQTQTVSRTQNRSVTVSWTTWSDVGGHKNCGAWGPDPSTVNYGQSFTQTRSCDQDQTRSRVYKVGTTTIHSVAENKTIKENETQSATGTKRDWQPTSSTYTSWVNDGARYNYGAWSPSAVAQTGSFTQTRSYSQNQDRYEQKREQDSITGDYRNVGAPILQERTITGSESRSVAVSWTSWVDSGGHYSCGAWGPDSSTVNYGQSFTQTRSCSQNQTRSRIYKVGTTTINTEQETRTLTESESQAATGTKRNWQSISSTYTAWTAMSNHTFTAWSPTAATQTSNFTQTRTYKQDQERYEQRREQDSITGDIRNVGTPIQHIQTVNKSQSRSVVVSRSAWTDSGSLYNCSTWSPAPNTVNYGQSFTQSRTCSQKQIRNRYYETGTTLLNTVIEDQVVQVDQTRTETGTYQNWEPMTSSASSWTDSGSRYGHTTWSPTPSTQTASYTQTRSYSQNQTRTVQQREYDTVTGTIRDVGSPVTESRTITGSESRTVTVSTTDWVNSGGVYSCSSWSPSASTVTSGTRFQQTRNCSQNVTSSRVHKVGSTTIYTQPLSSVTPATQTQYAYGTKTASDCRYSRSAPLYYYSPGDFGATIYWNGTSAYGGYSKGALKDSFYDGKAGKTIYYYEVCR